MIEYYEDGNLAIVDGYKFRRDKKSGYYLSSKRINGNRKRLHVYIWEKTHGPIPEGLTIHHKDHNKRNNELENFELLGNREHTKRHGAEMTAEARERAKQNLLITALPKATEWHKSEEGREWHRKHYEAMKDKLHASGRYVCSECGAEFTSNRIYGENENHFCCNNCKSAFRRKSGVDNEARRCAYCGAEFITNKYSKAKFCEKHRGKGRRS